MVGNTWFVVLVVLSSWFISESLCSPTDPSDYYLDAPPVSNSLVSSVEELAKATDEGAEGGEHDSEEGRSCGSCGLSPVAPTPSKHKLFSLLGDTKLMAIAVPILILQIITLSALAYLLKSQKKDDDFLDPSYYAAYPATAQTAGYRDSYSSYRSLIPSEDSMTWAMERISDAMDMYNEYQHGQNAL